MNREELLKKADEFARAHREEILRDLASLVEIPSVAVPGSEEPLPFGAECARVLERMLKMADEAGLSVKNAGNWYGLAELGEGEHSTGIFTHLDVVEAGDGWTFPPFAVTEKDGWVVGRGTADDKAAAVIALYAAKALKEMGLLKNSRLVIYFGCCEEKGMMDLDRYIAENAQPDFSLVPDFIFPVAVGASGVFKFEARKKEPFTELCSLTGGEPGERSPLKASVLYTGPRAEEMKRKAQETEGIRAEEEEKGLRITAEGRASSGFGKDDEVNAISLLSAYLAGSGVLTAPDEAAAQALWELTCDRTGARCGIDREVPVLGKTKLFPALVRKEGDEIVLTLRAQFPVPTPEEELIKRTSAWLSSLGYEGRAAVYADAWSVDPADPRVGILEEAWDAVCGKDAGVHSGGSTYAGKLQNAVNYGPKDFKHCPFEAAGRGDLHQADEAREISNILDGVKTYILACAGLDAYYGEA